MSTGKQSRLHQVVLIGSFIPLCWFAFMAVHELGHVFAGWATGGTVCKVVVHPLTISRTDVHPNPNPLLTVWAGPITGIGLPLLAWGLATKLRLRFHYLLRFFAGFCLLANGSYIAVGSMDRIGDAGDMLRHGSPVWLLWLFGLVSVSLGLLAWHRLGPHFGLGSARGQVEPQASYLSLGLLLVAVALMLGLSPQS